MFLWQHVVKIWSVGIYVGKEVLQLINNLTSLSNPSLPISHKLIVSVHSGSTIFLRHIQAYFAVCRRLYTVLRW